MCVCVGAVTWRIQKRDIAAMSLGRCLYVFCLFSILERTADVREKLWPVKWRGCCPLTERRREQDLKSQGVGVKWGMQVCTVKLLQAALFSLGKALQREKQGGDQWKKAFWRLLLCRVMHWLSCRSRLNWGMAGWQWKCVGPYSLRKANQWKISRESGQKVLVPEASWDLV